MHIEPCKAVRVIFRIVCNWTRPNEVLNLCSTLYLRHRNSGLALILDKQIFTKVPLCSTLTLRLSLKRFIIFAQSHECKSGGILRRKCSCCVDGSSLTSCGCYVIDASSGKAMRLHFRTQRNRFCLACKLVKSLNLSAPSK